ncbi:DRC1 protein, partial [Amia calva]|nr:DRC1 protein [Amia calva]
MSQLANGPEQHESGPSVESDVLEERLAARRLRMAARAEAKKREAVGDHAREKHDAREEPRKSQQQVEQSRKRMTKLQADGTELVTNIQVAADWRESRRRTEEEEAKRQRTEKLENEAKASLEKFEEIAKKWTSSRMKEIPQELRDALNTQQHQCALLIEEKNKVIHDLQQELKVSDNRYVKDLKKQAEDIDLMIERMEEQIKNLMKSYREEQDQIEKAFEMERRELLDNSFKKWEQMMHNRRDKELEYLTLRMKSVEEQEKQLQQLRVEDAEEYNMIKIKLETDVQLLEQQLQQMKATFQLNQEKLEYNFQVLKKRDEENTITKSQQKRRITRLQDVLNNLRIKLAKQEKQSWEDNRSLTDDYERIMQQYTDTQRKMRQFAAVDAKTFEEMWLMNEAEVKELVEKALETDRLIHEQQLGLAWMRPPLPFTARSGPVLPQRSTKRPAAQLAGELLLRGSEAGEEKVRGSGPAALVSPGSEPPAPDQEALDSGPLQGPSEEHVPISPQTVKRLLQILCDEAGFLIESKLLTLLSPLEKDQQSLMKLDAIFLALGIENEDDVYALTDFFIKYREQQGGNTEFSAEDSSLSQSEGRAERRREVSGMAPGGTVSDLIHPNDVLKALRAFTAHRCRTREKRLSKVLNLEDRDDSEDAAFWDAMARVIPESKLKTWDALETALEKYYHVLTERAALIDDTQGLKQQNAELRMLLHQYVNSRVNAELEIPPTQVMQMQPQGS